MFRVCSYMPFSARDLSRTSVFDIVDRNISLVPAGGRRARARRFPCLAWAPSPGSEPQSHEGHEEGRARRCDQGDHGSPPSCPSWLALNRPQRPLGMEPIARKASRGRRPSFSMRMVFWGFMQRTPRPAERGWSAAAGWSFPAWHGVHRSLPRLEPRPQPRCVRLFRGFGQGHTPVSREGRPPLDGHSPLGMGCIARNRKRPTLAGRPSSKPFEGAPPTPPPYPP